MNSTKDGWKAQYKRLYQEHRKRNYPMGYRDFPDMEPKMPSEKKANGLTQLIIKFLEWSGHYANRISTQGQARIHKIPKYNLSSETIQYSQSVQWTKGNTKKGTPDISAVIYGMSVWIEVKVGKDKMSEAQVEQKQKLQQAGAYYFVAHDMQSFCDWYYQLIEPKDPDRYTTLEGYE